MAIKIENASTATLPRNTIAQIERIIDTLPQEHLRGINRLRLVDAINDPRLRLPQSSQLPGLYHPRQGNQAAWLEVSMSVLLPRSKPFFKRLLPKLSFKGNLASVIFSLAGQHYYLTLRHSIKKGQIEPSVRAYTEKYLKIWSEGQHSLRTRIFKPLQPTFERWAKSLQRQAAKERKRTSGT
ncbi:MAG TPA: hypothetical protein VF703_12865 [Pyrinomonadaceae bacterium]|jgi:hypothetical protein